jgi:hypothetical protein
MISKVVGLAFGVDFEKLFPPYISYGKKQNQRNPYVLNRYSHGGVV